jgi:pimeloyl-ACP methyl ester carboxylesterase
MPNVNLPTGVDLYYESHGQGEPLVFIPSTAFSAEVWKPYQVPALSKSLNLIIHDPRGCGRSTVKQEVYTIDQMANDVVALLDHLGIRSAHVLGHSMGGRIGLMAWSTHAKLAEYVHLVIARHNWEGTHRLGDADAGRSNHLAQAEVLAKRIPSAELKILKGQSHGFFWQAPEETNNLILAWVKKHSHA